MPDYQLVDEGDYENIQHFRFDAKASAKGQA
jgi:hypothetical protein